MFIIVFHWLKSPLFYMDNEWLTYSTLRLPLGNDSLFWLLRENDRMKVLTHFYLNWQGVLTVSAEIKTRIYAPLWRGKENINFWLRVMFCLWWCLSRWMSSFGSCLGSDSGIPLKKHACLFRQKQGVPVKSTWHHCTRAQFHKPHKLAVASSVFRLCKTCLIHEIFLKKNKLCNAWK